MVGKAGANIMKKKRIAIIVQRYGKQINGGAEVHARMIAEKLSSKYDVTVLTSRALDYYTWKAELPRGKSTENGIKIIRFDHRGVPNEHDIHIINRMYRGRLWYQKLYRLLGKPSWFLHFFPLSGIKEIKEQRWLEDQGPAVYKLLHYLRKNENTYAAFIFFTYLYYPTAVGMPLVAHKSLLIPTMHDEPEAYHPFYKKVMAAPKRLLFNTESEKRFSEKMFPIKDVSKDIVAVGIDPVNESRDPAVLSKFNITGRYVIYVGRIDKVKGCEVLLEYFTNYTKKYGTDVSLVLAGKNMIASKSAVNIIYTGFVSDEEKLQLMKQAIALITPSKYESLSLVLLESFACRVPVIANRLCEVLEDHINASDGGWLFSDEEEFIECVHSAQARNDEREQKGLNGFNYVQKNYSWEKVLRQFDDAINFVIGSGK